MAERQPRHTPLYERHLALGGSMVDFGGYAMPQQYSGIREEHLAVRQRAGLFDISHMGEVRFQGRGALETLQRLCANNIARLHDGQALYGVMCNEQGGIVDDIIVYRDAEDDYLVVINAACRDKDVAWMRDHLGDETEFHDLSDELALLAVQGPRAVEIVARLTGPAAGDLRAVRPFHRVWGDVAGHHARISRTGYTGEDGFEIYLAGDAAPAVWDALLEAGQDAGIRPCGLGARDTLRLEAGLRLYGQDMDDTTDPFSAGLAWTVKLDKGIDCIGAAVLRGIDPARPPRRFVGLAFEGRAIGRHGQDVLAAGRRAGTVTSGTFSFTLGHGIATASVDGDLDAGVPLSVDIRGTVTPATTVPLPFYKRPA